MVLFRGSGVFFCYVRLFEGLVVFRDRVFVEMGWLFDFGFEILSLRSCLREDDGGPHTHWHWRKIFSFLFSSRGCAFCFGLYFLFTSFCSVLQYFEHS